MPTIAWDKSRLYLIDAKIHFYLSGVPELMCSGTLIWKHVGEQVHSWSCSDCGSTGFDRCYVSRPHLVTMPSPKYTRDPECISALLSCSLFSSITVESMCSHAMHAEGEWYLTVTATKEDGTSNQSIFLAKEYTLNEALCIVILRCLGYKVELSS